MSRFGNSPFRPDLDKPSRSHKSVPLVYAHTSAWMLHRCGKNAREMIALSKGRSVILKGAWFFTRLPQSLSPSHPLCPHCHPRAPARRSQPRSTSQQREEQSSRPSAPSPCRSVVTRAAAFSSTAAPCPPPCPVTWLSLPSDCWWRSRRAADSLATPGRPRGARRLHTQAGVSSGARPYHGTPCLVTYPRATRLYADARALGTRCKARLSVDVLGKTLRRET